MAKDWQKSQSLLPFMNDLLTRTAKFPKFQKKSGDFGKNLKLEEKGVNERMGE